MAGSIQQADKEFLETWEHISPQNWGITRLNPRGDEKDEVISGRRTFKLTTEERMITQDKIREPKLDPFKNGSFRPVVVPEGVTIDSNPNALADEDIIAILHSGDFAFEQWLETIDAIPTLNRMIEIAESDEDLSHKRFKAVEARTQELRDELHINIKDPHLKNFMSDKPNTGGDGNLAASGVANPRRRSNGGGMSADYR